MVPALKLAPSFDPDRLKADVARLPADGWTRHFNPADFDGDWQGVALRSSTGQANSLYPDPGVATYLDTPALEVCGYLRHVLSTFDCPLNSVRLLNLRSGSAIREHRDHQLGYTDGEVRLHIPIQTSDAVEFLLEGRRILMKEGECWYLDLSRPHAVRNRGASDRIHLVIDCVVNDWLRAALASGTPVATPDLRSDVGRTGAGDQFDAFRTAVLADSSLRQQLKETPDHAAFMATAVTLGAGLGYNFTIGDIEAGLRQSRRSWRERSRP